VRWPIVSMARAAALKLIHPHLADKEPALFVSSLIRRASVAAVSV
jgi:LacI family transcriptional regulator